MNFYNLLSQFEPTSPKESETKAACLGLIETHGAASFGRDIAGEIGHVTSGAWVINPQKTKVLLVFGAKENRWKLPGEHLESEAEIYQVARKEARRASDSNSVEAEGILFGLNQREIDEYWNTPKHWHFEVVWSFVAQETDALPRGARWFSFEEVASWEDDAMTLLIQKSK